MVKPWFYLKFMLLSLLMHVNLLYICLQPQLQSLKNLCQRHTTTSHFCNNLRITSGLVTFCKYPNQCLSAHKNSLASRMKTATIRDQSVQALFEKINNETQSFFYYKDLITFHGLQKYLKKMPPDIWIPLVKIRTNNHKLPVEMQSWRIFLKPRDERICNICNLREVGDEFHYLARCTVFSDERQKYIPSIIQDSSLQNFLQILKSDNIRILRGLAKFLNILFGVFE